MKRRFFQIHLLTAVVGMLLLGAFMGLNLTTYEDNFIKNSDDQNDGHTGVDEYSRGWPMSYTWIDVYEGPYVGEAALSFQLVTLLKKDRAQFEEEWARTKHPWYSPIHPNYIWHKSVVKNGWPYDKAGFFWHLLAINIAVALVTTLLFMVSTEWFLRRRERAKV